MEGEWELSKENIQPRKDGRDFNSLIAGLTPRKESMLQRASEMQRYEQAIRKNDGPDPLENWYKYIIWTEQNSPDGGSLEVKQILERCIQHFEKEDKYKSDSRYVKIWADIIREPLELFNYMHDKSIGSSHTIFFENWADALECVGNYQKADEVYQLGIARNAQPLLRLQRLHESRLAAKIKGDVDDFVQHDGEERASLASLKHAKSGKVDHDRIKAKSGKTSTGLKIQTSKKQIQAQPIVVYEDENASESKVPAARGEWKEPPINSKIIKENASKPAKWTSSKISSKQSTCLSQPGFMIHEDEDADMKPDRTPKQIVMSDRKPLSSKKVAKEPIINPLDTMKKIDECQFVERYCKSDVYLGNQEFSLEELRALNPKYAVQPIRDDCTSHFPTDMEETCVLGTEVKICIQQGTRSCALNTKNRAEVQQSEVADSNQDGLERSSFFPRNDVLQSLVKDEKSGTSRQRLNFSSATDKIHGGGLEKSVANLSTYGTCSNNLDESSLDSLDDIEDYMAGPVESTSKHNISRLPLPNQFKGIRDVMRDSEITEIGTKPVDGYNSMKFYGPTESTSVHGIPRFREEGDGFPGTGFEVSQISSKEDLSNENPRKMPENSIFVGDELEDDASFACLGPDIEFGKPELGGKNVNVVHETSTVRLPTVDPSAMNVSSARGDHPQNTGCWIQVSGNPLKPKVHPVQQLTPASKVKRSLPYNSGLAFPVPPKSPIWAPSPTIHTKVATQAIHEMWRADDFTINSTIEASNDFEQQFGDKPALAPGGCFKIFDDELNGDFGNEENQSIVSREKKPKLDETGVTGNNMKISRQQSSCTNALVDTQHMSVSHGRLEYTISDHTASNVSAKTSTPFFPAEPRPSFSCTAIGNLHDSEIQQADATQQLACDSKNLSTIQEQSGESSSDTFRKSSSSSSRGFSEGSESNIDAICSTTNRHLHNTPPVFVNDEVAKDSKPENKSAVHEDNILKKFAEAETSHVEAALHSLTLNAGLSNVSVSGRSFTSKPVDVSGSKAITAIVKTMEFEIYPNLTFETEKSLNERFFVNSKVLLGDDDYKIVKKVATGGFAVVYSAYNLSRGDSEETALKVMKSPILCQWEFHIGTQIQKRLVQNDIDPKLHDCFIQPLSGYVYSDAAAIQFPHHPGGTLLDLVNKHLKERVGQTDTFALLYGLNVCKLVKTMHDCSIIHGDVKPDNFLLNRVTGNVDNPTEINCLTLADFGRCLDLTLYSNTVTFIGSCNTDKFECIEMKKNLPWKYQIDYYGVAGTIHVVLHGTYLDCYLFGDRYKPVKVASRRQGKEFWASVFDRLLNVSDCNDQSVLEGIIKDFERRLIDPDRQKSLMELLSLQRAMASG
eukprot:gene3064-1349_t